MLVPMLAIITSESERVSIIERNVETTQASNGPERLEAQGRMI